MLAIEQCQQKLTSRPLFARSKFLLLGSTELQNNPSWKGGIREVWVQLLAPRWPTQKSDLTWLKALSRHFLIKGKQCFVEDGHKNLPSLVVSLPNTLFDHSLATNLLKAAAQLAVPLILGGIKRPPLFPKISLYNKKIQAHPKCFHFSPKILHIDFL